MTPQRHSLKCKKLHPDAKLPTRGTEGAAAFDLYAIEDTQIKVMPTSPAPAERVRTGIAVEIPPGYVGLVCSRSGHGAAYGSRLANSVGVIDSDYRGEVLCLVVSDRVPYKIKAGERFAQLLVMPAPQFAGFEFVDELSETGRGAGGFGSTGTA